MTIRLATVLSLLLAASTVRAEDCPSQLPEDAALRRPLAKKWFSKGEEATNAGNDIDALKAYQCSLKIVPHGFTAYNIAQLSEKIGDLELAIASYEQYLLLVPEAKDGSEVTEKVGLLKQRLARVRQGEMAIGDTLPANASADADISRKAGASGKKTSAKPAPDAQSDTANLSARHASDPAAGYRLAAWISLGGAVAAIGGGVVTNLLSRNKMDTCRSQYDQGNQSSAEEACSDAKPLAYTSYALFGIGAAAAVTGVILFMVSPKSEPGVAVSVLPEGGFALRWGGRF